MDTYRKEGYFGKILSSTGGDKGFNGLQGFEFKKEVLNQYTDLSETNPMEFRLDKQAGGGYYINHIGKWDLKCFLNRKGNIGAILIDLARLPLDQQQWWADHLID